MFRSLLPLIVLAACSNSGIQEPLQPLEAAGTVIDGEFIISADLDDDTLVDLGMEKLDYDLTLGAGLYRSDSGVTQTALESILKERIRDGVRVEHNRSVRASAADPYRSLQWNLDMLDIETAWQTSTGAGVTVAVIDTGVTWAGEDTPVNLIAGWDYVDNDGDPTDLNGHGTHVAGTIAQATDNGRGVAGVAPDTTIMAIRVLDRYGSGSVYWSAKGIRYAADNGADVINLSLGSPYGSAIEEDAVDYAVSSGVVVVAASGNSGRATLDYPAAYADVISVGAVDARGVVTNYSNGGAGLDLVAPGGDTSRDRNGDGYGDGILQETLGYSGTSYQFFEGTSMAAPHVAGAAAMLLSAGAKPWEVRQLLVDTAIDVEASGVDTWAGYGLLDVVTALDLVAPPAPPSSGGGDSGSTEPPSSGDTTAPVISGVGGERSNGVLTLWWDTNEPATTEIEFEDYGLFGDSSTLSTSHELAFYIDPNQSYYFTIVATDAAGNTSEDGLWVSNP